MALRQFLLVNNGINELLDLLNGFLLCMPDFSLAHQFIACLVVPGRLISRLAHTGYFQRGLESILLQILCALVLP